MCNIFGRMYCDLKYFFFLTFYAGCHLICTQCFVVVHHKAELCKTTQFSTTYLSFQVYLCFYVYRGLVLTSSAALLLH